MERAQWPETIDLRIVFKCYAAVAGVAGLLVIGWGQLWFGAHLAGQPFGKAALIRVCGAILVAAACCALGFAAGNDPWTVRRGMFWFAVAHLVVCVIVQSQRIAIWGPGTADGISWLSIAAAFFLFNIWGLSRTPPNGSVLLGLFRSAPPADEHLRSRYEQQIRAAARQEERNRLARDLHDSIKQQIFVIQTAAATAQTRLEGDDAGARQALDQVRTSAREAMTEMQVMLDQMAAAPLENAGLIEALRKQCDALGFRTGSTVDFKLGELPEANTLEPGAHEAILRTAQEALANIGRHARAAHVMVSLGMAGREVRLQVEDDGAGFDATHAPRGQGIANMRARAEEYGGSFELDSRPGSGTSVTLSIPYRRPDRAVVYRDRAIELGVSLAVAAVLVVWTRSPLVVAVAAVAAVMTARSIVAYRRARAAESTQ
jgi:signal transduction histidine kinase